MAETADQLAGHEVVPPLVAAAEEALARLDWPTATAAYIARVAPGAESQRIWQLPADLDIAPAGLGDAAARLGRRGLRLPAASGLRSCASRYPQNGALALTGHAHIDLAWLWPLAETRRKAQPHLPDHARR